MTSKANEPPSQVLPQGDNAALSGAQAGPPEHQGSRTRNQVLKSGPLFISSKGIGWTSWKKRWFVLTRTSLVFYRSDPSATPQKTGEMNLTLGGIDLNNSASVEVKVDKKLLTVLFPDGRDGRAFTLKAETLDDLNEWKTALENAVKLAPNATQPAGQNGRSKNEQANNANDSTDQQKEKPPATSMVIGRPILLALEDIDGSPSFLEKALRFVEDHGVKVEGILRQAADVDDVHRRVREYEQGKTEFSAEEDAHVIGDCIKYILRELPSSPVPASCCNALLEAFRTDRNNRLNAMRSAILETFPEPNRRLLQRILLMMQTVESNKTINRMSTSAVAACMSPLLLRPLLAGDCELENTHMDVAGDGSFQLLQAAAAANHAQAIIITLMDEYDNIFGEGSTSGGLFSDSDESGSETEEATDDEEYLDDDDYASDDHDEETDEDYEHSVIETCSESGDQAESDYSCDEKASRSSSFSKSPERDNRQRAKPKSPSSTPSSPLPWKHNEQKGDDNVKRINERSAAEIDEFGKSHRLANIDTHSSNDLASSSPRETPSDKLLGSSQARNTPLWGRTSAKKNHSTESIDFSFEDEDDEIQRLEAAKIDLQNRITEEANGNAILQASLERRKKGLLERRLALQKDVNRLQETLQKEKDLRAALESKSNLSQLPSSASISEKEIALAEENFNNLKQRFDDLGEQIRHQHEHNAAILHDRYVEIQDASRQRLTLMNTRDHETKGTLNHAERSSNDNGQQNYSTEGHNRDDTSRGGLPKFGLPPNNSHSPGAASATKPSPTKKSSSKGEGGGNVTISAISKLSTRLNFLKERRRQIADELKNLDKSKGSPSSNHPALSPRKGNAPELSSPRKGSASELLSPRKGSASELPSPSKGRAPDLPSPGKGKAPELPSPGKGKAPELPIVQRQDDHGNQSSRSSTYEMSTEGTNNNKDSDKKSDFKRYSNLKSDAPSSYSSDKVMSNEGDYYKDDNKKSDNKRSSNSKLDAPSSYSSSKGMSNEGDRREGDYKEDKKKSDKIRSPNSSDAPSSYYNSSKDISSEGDNTNDKKKSDNIKSSNSKSDAPSLYSSSKGMSNEGGRREGDYKDDYKRSTNSKLDAPSSYSSSKEKSYDGDNKDDKKKSDSKRSSNSKSDARSSYSSSKEISNECDNKDDNIKSSTSKPDAPSVYSSKGMSIEGDRREGDYKDDGKKGDSERTSDSKSDAPPSYSSDKDRKKKNDKKRNTNNSKPDAPSSYSSGKVMPDEGDFKDIGEKSDNKQSSDSKSDAPSFYGLGKGVLNDGYNEYSKEKTDNKRNSNPKSDAPSSYGSGRRQVNEDYNEDSKEKTDNKRSSNSKFDAPSYYGSGKGLLNEGYNEDIREKSDNNKRSSNPKSGAPSPYVLSEGANSVVNTDDNKKSSVQAVSTEGDSTESKKRSKSRSSRKKSSKSKPDSLTSQNVDQGQKSEHH